VSLVAVKKRRGILSGEVKKEFGRKKMSQQVEILAGPHTISEGTGTSKTHVSGEQVSHPIERGHAKLKLGRP